MKNKILIPLLVLGALAAFFSFKYTGGGDESTNKKEEATMKAVLKAIKQDHFSPKEINDTFSVKVYNRLIDQLDGDKKIFTQADIDVLKRYQYKIDDDLNNSSLEFFKVLFDKHNTGVNNAEKYCAEILQQPFTFTSNEKIQLNGDKLAYVADMNGMKDRWRQYLKFRVLAKYVELKDDRDKKKADKNNKDTIKTDAELEIAARTSIKKNMDYYFKRMHKLKEDDKFGIYMNAVTNNEDPHTDFLPPRDKAKFDEMMSGTFVGIGALLRDEDGKIKIQEVITGSPCWKQGELKAGDEILKVAQGEKEPVDIQGYDIDDAVKLIRGEKHTEVRLTVKKPDGATKVIPIVRDAVEREELFAKSAIIKSPTGPVGYIYLPEFYSDFQNMNGRRCAEDVALEVEKLKNAGVQGIILDLRYNGGGSLNDVVEMAGIFVDQGPIVQVKTNGNAPVLLPDREKGVRYDGPMAIMVNEGSASASEIMAAAMQDYKRAIIVGATTYGKGTVQKLVPLDNYADPIAKALMSEEEKEKYVDANALGSLKVTIQKFYRVNGGSTQLKGVTPDIQLPNSYEDIEMGERRDKAAMKWDEIKPAPYKPYENPVNSADLAAQSKKRTGSNETFKLIQENAARLKKLEENNQVSLNEVAYKKENEATNAISKKIEEAQKKVTPFDMGNPKEDLARINLDSNSIKKNDEWLKNLKKDIYLSETVNIINDMNKGWMKVNMGTGMK